MNKGKLILIIVLFFTTFLLGCENPNKENNDTNKQEDKNETDKQTQYSLIYENEIIKKQTNSNFDINFIIKQDNEYLYIVQKIEKIDEYTYEAITRKEKRVYMITFDGDGGNLISGEDVQYKTYMDKIEYPVYFKTGYQFIGFDKEIDQVTKDEIITAQYQKLTIRDISSFDLIKEIKFGYNIVNIEKDDFSIAKYLDLLIDSGINAIALPINFFPYTDKESYEIDQNIINRLIEVTDIAISKNMFVVLTCYDYYDDEWSTLCLKNQSKLIEITKVQWTQLGEAFKKYDEHVLFSYLNEPRFYQTNGYTDEGALVLNKVNQEFVKLIRSQGYNNLYRHLLVTSIWSNPEEYYTNLFQMPDDDKVIYNFHAYLPFGLVHEPSYTEKKFSDNYIEYEAEINKRFSLVYENFISKGIPVLLMEFGIREKGEPEEVAKYLEYYLSVAYNYGIKCFIWDSAILHYDIEFSFALTSKTEYKWRYQIYEDTIKKMFVDGEFIDFFKEEKPYTIYIDIPLDFSNEFNFLLSDETKEVHFVYDEHYINIIDGKIYGIRTGTTYIRFYNKGITHSFMVNILPNYYQYNSEIELKVDYVNDLYQCYICTPHISAMRVDYDWFSSDESILKISKYSTITPVSDGTCAIIAISKETNKYGVMEVTIKNGKVESFTPIIG